MILSYEQVDKAVERDEKKEAKVQQRQAELEQRRRERLAAKAEQDRWAAAGHCHKLSFAIRSVDTYTQDTQGDKRMQILCCTGVQKLLIAVVALGS